MLIPLQYAKFEEYVEIPGAPESPGLRINATSKHTMVLDSDLHVVTIRHLDLRHPPSHIPLTSVKYMVEVSPVSATAVEPVVSTPPVETSEAKIIVKTPPPKGKLAPPDAASDT